MPLTFPSHAAVVLPLKLWRPRWFDGVALVVGAGSPDLAYAFDGSGLPVYPLSHQWSGLVLFCLPVTLVCGILVRRAAPVVAAHLPSRPVVFALRDYGVIGTYRPAVAVSAASALLGAASHIVWDRLANNDDLMAGVLGQWWAGVDDRTWGLLVDLPSSLLGAVGVLGFALMIGRRRLLRTWHGPAPAEPTDPRRFWTVAAVTVAGGILLALALPGALLPHTTGVRVIAAVAFGLILGAAAVRRRAAAGTPPRYPAARRRGGDG